MDAKLSLRHYGPSPGSHSHAHYQVLWGRRGALELEIEGRGTRIRAGRVAIIPPGARHDFWATGEGSECFVLDSDAAALEPLAGQVLPWASGTPHLLRFVAQGPPAERLSAAAAELMLATLHAPVPVPTPERVRRGIDWAALDAWIDAHLAEPLTVAALAARVHLGATQFAARCVEETGLSVMAYVRERRLAAAWRWRCEGLAVSRVAQRCGYRSPSALTAALRRSLR